MLRNLRNRKLKTRIEVCKKLSGWVPPHSLTAHTHTPKTQKTLGFFSSSSGTWLLLLLLFAFYPVRNAIWGPREGKRAKKHISFQPPFSLKREKVLYTHSRMDIKRGRNSELVIETHIYCRAHVRVFLLPRFFTPCYFPFLFFLSLSLFPFGGVHWSVHYLMISPRWLISTFGSILSFSLSLLSLM